MGVRSSRCTAISEVDGFVGVAASTRPFLCDQASADAEVIAMSTAKRQEIRASQFAIMMGTGTSDCRVC
jgi:hypothetical protein